MFRPAPTHTHRYASVFIRRRVTCFRRTRTVAVCLLSVLATHPALVFATDSDSKKNSARRAAIEEQRSALLKIVSSKGGFDAWWEQLEEFRNDVQQEMRPVLDKQLPFSPYGDKPKYKPALYFGYNNRVYNPREVIATLCNRNWPVLDLSKVPNPRRHVGLAVTDFSDQLRARGIDLIFVPIPEAAEIYSETISDKVPEDRQVSPQRTRLLLALLASNVEVIDLLPAFNQARRENGETLFFYRDSHWSGRGIEVAAEAIAQRLRRYRPTGAAETAGEPNKYAPRQIRYQRKGNMVVLMVPRQTHGLRPITYDLTVFEDEHGVPYRETPGAPILIIGDSNIGMGPLIEIGGRLSAHVAHHTGMPVETLWNHGAFSNANALLARSGADFLKGRKVIVWVGRGKSLSQPNWQTVQLP